MAQIENAGNGFIKRGEFALNLKAIQSIQKKALGLGDPDGHIGGIAVTPIQPSDEERRNGVDGTYFLTLYQEGNFDEWEEDWQIVLEALKQV